ncbi:hypothetical protein [Rhizobium sp. RU36D]|uniref:hypothetical protein n=1 Tax=Rhizobium sp. RU36D TaxID=1907415 RepID=UPI0009D82D7D|nr:hypothetical protein [Rhizobium sp. RU36D]SMD18046.1 hypothetical protein SAMN05880593_1346 [Rhizobium sp. RU36D]
MYRLITFSRVFALLVILALASFVLWPLFAAAAEALPAVGAPSIWPELWAIVQPVVAVFFSLVGPALATWIAVRLLAVLKISDDAKRLEIEAQLRQALHQSAANALRYAMAKSGLTTSAATIAPAVLKEAVRYVEDKNPDALARLDVSPDALRDIIMSKVPDLLQQR